MRVKWLANTLKIQGKLLILGLKAREKSISWLLVPTAQFPLNSSNGSLMPFRR